MFNAVPVVGPFVIEAHLNQESAPHELQVTFNEDVWESLEGSDLVLINENSRYLVPSEVITVNWDFDTNTASFVFVRLENSGVLSEGNWHATLLSEGITNAQGQPLDGDNDQLEGGNFEFDFTFIRGDANQDGIVDLQDYAQVAANFGQTERTFSQGDFNYDNRVNLADINIFLDRFASTNPNATGSPFGQNSANLPDTGNDELV